ncbi:Uncharacterized protein GBIM_18383 [Gryllus bimaculatus]|nr:Uncharacterized protein GBIM_18383 [Gryllus bimaculatus]
MKSHARHEEDTGSNCFKQQKADVIYLSKAPLRSASVPALCPAAASRRRVTGLRTDSRMPYVGGRAGRGGDCSGRSGMLSGRCERAGGRVSEPWPPTRAVSEKDPEFGEPIGNLTTPLGREAVLSCIVDHLGKYKYLLDKA